MLRCQGGCGSVPTCHLQCYLWVATSAARGVWRCWRAAAQWHQSPSHALQSGKSPAAASPFHLPTRRVASGGGGLLRHGLGAHCPTTHPETCLIRAVSTHPPSKPCSPFWPTPWPPVTPLHCHSLIPRDPPSPSQRSHARTAPTHRVLLPQPLQSPSTALAGTPAPCLLSPCPIPGVGSVRLRE